MGGNRHVSTKQRILTGSSFQSPQLTAEEQIRQQCQARKDYLYWERIRAAKIAKQKKLEEKDTYFAELEAKVQQQNYIFSSSCHNK